MEGMMLSFPRPRPPPPPPLQQAARRRPAPPLSIVTGGGRNHRSCSCRRAASAAVPSIWHAITPSSGCAAASRALRRRRGRGASAEEGSWNAGWDARPARWLHGPDSAWLLFGVCACYCPVRGDAAVEAGTGEVAVGDRKPPAEDYKLIGMSADGRCLFRAVSYGACLATGKEAPDSTQQKELADDLRAHVVDELIKRRNEVERFIEDDFDIYIERIRQPYVWGGEPELLMASHVLRTCLSVFMIDKSSKQLVNIAKYGEEYKKDEDMSIKVLFHGYGHYDAIEIAAGAQ